MRTIIIILAAFLLMTPGISAAQMHGGGMHGGSGSMMGSGQHHDGPAQPGHDEPNDG